MTADRDDIAAAFAEDRARQLRSRAEYRAVPDTSRQTVGPCIRGCGRTAFTHKGVCRECLTTDRHKGER
jgi:hypothetical protein